MAKRRKIDSRVVLLLVLLGVVLLVGIGGMSIWMMPRDPSIPAAKAETSWHSGDYRDARSEYLKAIDYAQRKKDKRQAEYMFSFAQMLDEWNAKDPGLTQTDRDENSRRSRGALEAALRVEPDSVEIQRYLAQTWWDLAASTRNSDVFTMYAQAADRLLELQPDDAETLYRRSVAKSRQAISMGDEAVNAVLADMKRATELSPKTLEYRRGMASILALAGRPKEAEDVYKEAIESNPQTIEFRLFYADDMLWPGGRRQEAVQQVQEAIKVNPKSADAYIQLAQYQASDKDLNAANKSLQKALEVDPTNARAYAVTANLKRRSKDLSGANDALRTGLSALSTRADELSKQDKPSQTEVAQLNGGRAMLNFQLSDVLLDQAAAETDAAKKADIIAQARAIYETQRAVSGNSPFVRKLQGRLAIMDQKPKDAMDAFKAANIGFMQLGQPDVDVVNNLMRLYDLSGSPGEADLVLNQLMSVPEFRKNANITLVKARREIMYHRYDQALTYAKEAQRIDPSSEEAQSIAAMLSGQQSTTAAADQYSMQYAVDQAERMWIEQKKDEAISIVEQLHAKNPDDLMLSLELADFYRRAKRTDQMNALLDDVRQKNASNELVTLQIQAMRETDPEKRYQMQLTVVEKAYPNDQLRQALAKAGLAGTNGKYQEQLQFLQAAEKQDASNAQLISALFTYGMARGDMGMAKDYLARARRAELDESILSQMRYYLAIGEKNYSEAIAVQRESLSRNSDDKSEWLRLGEAQLAAGNVDDAKQAFLEAERRDPTYAPAVIDLARVAERAGNAKEQEEWVRRAYELPGARSDAWVRDQYLTLMEKDADLKTITGQLIPQREDMARTNPDMLGNFVRLARLYERAERYDEAERTLRSVMSEASDPVAAATPLAAFYLRTNKAAQIDKLFGSLLGEAKTPQEQARIYETWGNFMSATSMDQAIKLLARAHEVAPDYAEAYRTEAAMLAGKRRWSEAADAQDQFLRRVPNDGGARRDMVLYLVNANRMDDANSRLDQLLADQPSDPGSLTLRAMVLEHQGQTEKALGILDRAIQMNPAAANPLHYRGDLYFQRGDLAKAREDYQRAMSLSDNPMIAQKLANAYSAMGDVGQAEQMYKQMIEKNAHNEDAIDRLWKLYSSRKEWDQAEELVAAAQKAMPNSSKYLLMESQMWLARGDTPKRLAAAQKAVQLSPQSVVAVNGYLAALIASHKFTEANDFASRYLQTEGWAAIAHGGLGAAAARQNQSDAAMSHFGEAFAQATDSQVPDVIAYLIMAYGPAASDKLRLLADQRPTDWRMEQNLGQLLQMTAGNDQARLEQAAKAYAKAAELAQNPADRATALYLKGLMLGMVNRWDDSVNAYLDSLKLAADNPSTLNNLAYIYVEKLNQPEKAEPLAKRAAELSPTDPGVLDTYAWVMAKMGKYDEAKEVLLEAIQLDRTLVEARYHLGWVYEQSGALDVAVEHYRTASLLLADRPKDDPLRIEIEQAVTRVSKPVAAGS